MERDGFFHDLLLVYATAQGSRQQAGQATDPLQSPDGPDNSDILLVLCSGDFDKFPHSSHDVRPCPFLESDEISKGRENLESLGDMRDMQ